MARENPSWGEGRIADELSLKLGLLVDTRTVGKYLKLGGRPAATVWSTLGDVHSQSWQCDRRLRLLYLGDRYVSSFVRLCRDRDWFAADSSRQCDRSSECRLEFREFLDGESGHRYLIHDRDSVFTVEVDAALKGFGLRVLKTPVRSLMANAHCERVIGSIRRECLDYLIPLNERHLKHILREFITHYNRGRPHSALGPGFPEPMQATVPASGHRHRLAPGHRVAQTPVLGGLHHEYRLERDVA